METRRDEILEKLEEAILTALDNGEFSDAVALVSTRENLVEEILDAESELDDEEFDDDELEEDDDDDLDDEDEEDFNA